MRALKRDLLVAEIEQLTQQLQRVEQELERFSKTHPAVEQLQTIPGVGGRTAEAMVALWFGFYNYCRKHMTLKETPAMACGLADHVWSIRELIEESAKH